MHVLELGSGGWHRMAPVEDCKRTGYVHGRLPGRRSAREDEPMEVQVKKWL